MKILMNILGCIFFLFCIGYLLSHPDFPAAIKGLFYAGLFFLVIMLILAGIRK